MTALEALEKDIIACRRCTRLVTYREEVARTKRKAYREWEYWGRPVPGFGDPQAQVLVVGLAPGAHGSNRTGRMFTGDASGDFLYPALYAAGFANQPTALKVGDGLELQRMFITAVGRCAPPDNKPTPEELISCEPYLAAELNLLSAVKGVVALGKIAFDRMVGFWKREGHDLPKMEFAHGALYAPGENLPWLLASYHPSRQNTQTGRLTPAMFAAIWQQVNDLLKAEPRSNAGG